MDAIVWIALVFVTQIAIPSAAFPLFPRIGGVLGQTYEIAIPSAAFPPVPRIGAVLDQTYDMIRKPGPTPSPRHWVTASPTANPTTISQLLTTASPTLESSPSFPWWGFYVIIGCLVVVILIAIALKGCVMRIVNYRPT